jgi:hypothetical protein
MTVAWLHHLQKGAPVGVDLARQYPEKAVKIVDTGTFGLAFVDVELLLLEKGE